MKTISELQDIITDKIEQLQLKGKPVELYEPVNYLMHLGGKRLRPALLLAACNLYTENLTQAELAAIGMEMFHNFTLMHDDIMDKSDIRRGKPTVHKKWNENIAILSGDAMMFLAAEYICQSETGNLPALMQLFNKTAIEVCEGQQLDMNFENLTQVSIPEYINMIRLKTSVLIAACLKMGAMIGNAPESDARFLYDFGLNLGIAFQLQDDLLDIYADQSVFGKAIGGDIFADKKTFFMIKALETATGNDRDELNRLIGNKQISRTDKVNAVTLIYNNLNIKQLAEDRIQFYGNQAIEALDKVSIEKNQKSELYLFANQLLNRNF